MRRLRRVRLTILHSADRTHVVTDVPSTSKLRNATSQHTVAAPTTVICCIDEGYELVLSLYNLPQFAYLFPSLLSHFWLTCHFCFFIFSASFFLCLYCFCVHICLSLPSTLLLCHYALFFVVFSSLAPPIKFSFLLCFIASFYHLPSVVFLSPRLLFLPRFVPFFLFVPFFPACFYSLWSFVSLKLYVFPLTFILFSCYSGFPSLVSFFSFIT
jgi:hypothetical protein